MLISKWGNSLAVRLPKALVEELGLKEGDEIELRRAPDGAIEVARRTKIEDALTGLRSLRGAFPEGYRFNRDECYPMRRGGSGPDD
jgi:antitoxin MazE